MAVRRRGRHVDVLPGLIVTQERKKGPRRLTSMNIIDGQQRMSTLQVLLATARALAIEAGCEAVAGRLEAFVTNNERAIPTLTIPRTCASFCPCPKTGTATCGQYLSLAQISNAPAGVQRMCSAREWLESQMKWLVSDGVDTARRIEALHFAIDERIQIVHITLRRRAKILRSSSRH